MAIRALAGRLCALLFLASPAMAAATDSIALPPVQREFASPSGEFTLIVSADDQWKTPRATAALYAKRSGTLQRVWTRQLPHHHGPRKVLLSEQGDSLLVDEWINILSRHALLLIDRRNQVIVEYSAQDVFAALGLSAREVGASAREGPWLADGPTLSADGQRALLRAGACTLEVRLADGKLSTVCPARP
ncbi:hypothetical protein [Rhodocyclus tenuis]|uniref:hypothetical protein n=1 Tax=Rhodocyclus tenuis TaxID=1066 RepID=UPI001907A1A2|nr:hypothetical protein [Rhodocyclus tenuis]MBK1681735.1 hypothetical protein [Rhodocyclus tenuis]